MGLFGPSKKEKQLTAMVNKYGKIAATESKKRKEAQQNLSQLENQFSQHENKRKKLASDALRHGSSEGGRQMRELRKPK